MVIMVAPYSYVDENAWKLGIKNKEIYKYDADYLAEYDAEEFNHQFD